MTESSFKTEFSQLLLRFSFTDNKMPDMPPRLTNQQILDAIHDVLRATLNINLQNIEATALKTPANEIVMTTPHAPDILRVDYNQNTLKSRLSLGTVNDDDYSKSNLGTLLNVTEEKSDTSVSDTSIGTKSENSTNKEFEKTNALFDAAESAKDSVAKEQKALDERFKNQTSKMDITKNLTMFNIVDEAHKGTMKILHKLENLKELLMPESRPVRRLSAIMSLPMKQQHSSAPSQHKSSVAPGMSLLRSRRSIHQLSDDVPVTPTSRMSLLPQPSGAVASAAKKPAASAAVAPKSATSKLAQSKGRSESTPMLAELHKTAPGTGQPAKSPVKNKNPKYAHVQSTIPKPTSTSIKRKT